jgi:superoxide dismutase, Cu-Zn family
MKLDRLVLACILGASATMISTTAEAKEARAKLLNADGHRVGTVWFQEDDGIVGVRVKVNGLLPGFHGFHVHETGICTPPSFTSAGFHFHPNESGGGGTPHPSEAGDMPVLLVNADGTGEAKFQTDRFSVAELVHGDGTAIIVHAAPDNYANIPTRYASAPDATTLNTGDAGGRIACGVVELDD